MKAVVAALVPLFLLSCAAVGYSGARAKLPYNKANEAGSSARAANADGAPVRSRMEAIQIWQGVIDLALPDRRITARGVPNAVGIKEVWLPRAASHEFTALNDELGHQTFRATYQTYDCRAANLRLPIDELCASGGRVVELSLFSSLDPGEPPSPKCVTNEQAIFSLVRRGARLQPRSPLAAHPPTQPPIPDEAWVPFDELSFPREKIQIAPHDDLARCMYMLSIYKIEAT